ncbi:peroxiredoxin family protein [Lysinibacillus piscis]|uniref:Thiol:disulfide interchange protein tlpA n=1 Tax=Lysinibacillus piscis TaxID=2518931 RepID=A0ABQ5NHK1_9BACI|nr:TlpA disulfide reductase family protein [Lysinibacillus sp. KH24]GLC87770.1 thiol:disulfide interchange protein tlpA [Lysinibacillus sp. KH24]
MKKNIGLLVIVVLIAVMVGSIVKQQIEKERQIEDVSLGKELDEREIGLKNGDTAPAITLTSLDGENINLQDLRGKKVVLNFWATWCPPCKAEMPHMQEYYEQHAKKDNVEILAVNLTKEERDVTEDAKIDTVMTFKDSFELTFPILLDPNHVAGSTYQIIAIPTTYFIDSKGIIQRAIKGPMNVDMLQQYVDELE